MVILRIRRSDGSTERLVFEKPEVAIGRDAAVNDIVIGESSVSKAHALIARTSGGAILTDLKSTNGTLVNGTPVASAFSLRQGDEIAIGSTKIWIDPETMQLPRRPYEEVALHRPAAGAPAGGAPAYGQPTRNPDTAPGGIDVVALQSMQMRAAAPAPSGSAPYVVGATMPPPPMQTDGQQAHAAVPAAADGQKGAAKPAAAPAADKKREAFAAALTTLVDRVVKVMNVEPFTKATAPPADAIKKLEEVLAAQIKTIPDVPAPMATQLVSAARREFVDTGPIGPWLDEAEITQIQCLRYNQIELTRSGKIVQSDVSFSSGAAMQRAMVRLAKVSGREWAKGELVVERRIANGARLVAMVPPMAASLSMTIRKREIFARSMADYVKKSVLSEGMAAFLTKCLRSRVNIFVSGPTEPRVLQMVAALASATPTTHRIAVFHAGGEIRIDQRRTYAFGLPTAGVAEEQTFRTNILVGFENTLCVSPKACVAAHAAMAIVGGGSGWVVGQRGRSLQKSLSATIAELVLAKPGLSFHAASRLAAHAFEVGIEIMPLQGTWCVGRIAELEPGAPGQPPVLRDLFLRTSAGGKDAVFAQTAAVTRAFRD